MYINNKTIAKYSKLLNKFLFILSPLFGDELNRPAIRWYYYTG